MPLAVVLDLKSGAVVLVGDGKGADALLSFWKRLRASHAKIEAVATGMSPAYIDAVRPTCPKQHGRSFLCDETLQRKTLSTALRLAARSDRRTGEKVDQRNSLAVGQAIRVLHSLSGGYAPGKCGLPPIG